LRQIPALPVAPAVAAGRGSQGTNGGRSRIRADGFLDHEFIERRETYKTLKVFVFFAVVAAVLLIVTVYMRSWMLK
jgi:hypothetical protein